MTIPASWPHPPPYLLLTLLLGLTGVTGEKELQVIQPQKSVLVASGETATLNCTLTSMVPQGPIRWFKGTGPGREAIYSFLQSERFYFPRVTNATDITKRNNTDYSILIAHITPADADTYYCVQYQDLTHMEFTSATGTRLTVKDPATSTEFLIAFLLGHKVLLAAGVSAIYVHRKLRA